MQRPEVLNEPDVSGDLAEACVAVVGGRAGHTEPQKPRQQVEADNVGWTHAEATEATHRSVSDRVKSTQPLCQRGKLRSSEAPRLGHME